MPTDLGEHAPDRRVIRITGADRHSFLQGLVSNDVGRLAEGPVYAALLSPQGKYLADFLLVQAGAAVLLDVAATLAPGLVQRLGLYRLRADVTLEQTEMTVARGLGAPPPGAVADPRHPALGWRAYGAAGGAPAIDWDAIRVTHLIPESGIELVPNESYILECDFERLHGVDFRKGCYVGQEVTARMKHKTDLKKGLVRLRVDGAVPVGTPILADGKEAGVLYTQSGGAGIAFLRLDRAQGELRAGPARLAPG